MKTFPVILAIIVSVSSTTTQFRNANNIFSALLYKKYSENAEGNFLLSPFSTEAVLALTYPGCRGETAEEIRSILNLADPEFDFKNIDFLSPHYTTHIAKKIYVQSNYPIRRNFILRADCENINFRRKSYASNIINSWVEEKTNNKIKNLIDASKLHDETKIILVNALYLKANWSHPFPSKLTQKMEFYLPNNEIVKTDTMILHSRTLKYYENQNLGAEFLEIPFKGEDASMVIVLPNQTNNLRFLETHIKEILGTSTFSEHFINLSMPKFKIETSTDMKPILKKMGITKMFDENQADLSGISGQKGDLVVDKVAQKTYIDVSEEGVEAAAATYSAGVVLLSGQSENPKNVRVDRPFIFYIKVRGVVIFVGRVTDPRPEDAESERDAEDVKSRILFYY